MAYLECDKCGGQYQLEENESPEDFDETCECGGKLKYVTSSDRIHRTKILSNINNPGVPCPYCDYKNKSNAKFCKQCGKKLEKNLISQINDEINLFAVFIGLGVSCIVLIIGSLLFGAIVASASLDISIYIGVVLVFMALCGGTTTGIVGGHDFKDGAINGFFMSLVALVILGFIVGLFLFIAMGITAALSSAFSSYSSAATSSSLGSSTSSSAGSGDFFLTIFKGIVIMILIFVFGAVGGSFGVFIKKALKSVSN
ncbi:MULTISPECIES: zinc ribbon domain-containing protein [Methanobacterium]|jgi:hypothetical protein|uniref:Zinc-ribbon domain-containing protein n=1 Tax=Methanobacterium formicicum TaxID=2162 RepID=A0A843AS07_METFO|nr:MULTISPECIES: zinc ribbon domain-containing protein [Methanobacterium]KUK72734.1 MAG: hypothetical protein XD90_1765 [Methanobacterium sp. 42_16]MBF4475950.1 hypothetical protein [Methanobacterium formicicum]